LDIRHLAISELIAADPLRSIERTLALMRTRTEATIAGLFVVRGEVELLAGVEVDQAGFDRTRAAWGLYESVLRDGRPSWSGDWCVWPIECASGQILVYLASETTLQVKVVRESITALADLLRTAVEVQLDTMPRELSAMIDSYLKLTPADEVERRQLVAILGKHEWNLSRTARALGVARRTIYYRLERLGITRLKVSKT
jgi:DNA-binding protein Fis